MCCGVLQCFAVCCSVLQCAAVWCSVCIYMYIHLVLSGKSLSVKKETEIRVQRDKMRKYERERQIHCTKIDRPVGRLKKCLKKHIFCPFLRCSYHLFIFLYAFYIMRDPRHLRIKIPSALNDPLVLCPP